MPQRKRLAQLTQKPDLKFNINEGEPISFFYGCAKLILDRYKLKKKGVLVDIGAHIGVVDILGNKNYGWEFCIGVEAHLPNFVRFLDNVNINECEGEILPIWAAVSNKSYQKGTLYSNGKGKNSGIQSLDYKDNYPSEKVCLVTLKDIIGNVPKIDLLKIDIEGGEWDLFTDENREIFERARWVDIELHNFEADKKHQDDLYVGKGGTKQGAKEYLESCGFKLSWEQVTWYGPKR